LNKEEITMTSVTELAKRWGCSKNFVWERCKIGKIPSMKIDDRWFIPTKWVLSVEADLDSLYEGDSNN